MDEGDTRLRHKNRIIADPKLGVFGIGTATCGQGLRVIFAAARLACSLPSHLKRLAVIPRIQSVFS